jgi:hypothetical protein
MQAPSYASVRALSNPGASLGPRRLRTSHMELSPSCLLVWWQPWETSTATVSMTSPCCSRAMLGSPRLALTNPTGARSACITETVSREMGISLQWSTNR